jgi:hypothetical protein
MHASHEKKPAHEASSRENVSKVVEPGRRLA